MSGIVLTRESADVAVIGAGPAGLAAATAAASAGARVICLDLFARPGGQYHMQPEFPAPGLEQSPQLRAGRAAEAAARAAGVIVRSGHELFWAATSPAGFTLHASAGPRAALRVSARTLVAATGAMERPLPFDGWTLPGVIGAGAAQRLVKAGGPAPRLPGNPGKVVLAGSGPFLLAVAASFAAAGEGLDHLVEARRPGMAAILRLMATHPGRAAEALGLIRKAGATGARYHRGWAVARAIGQSRVEAVELVGIDAAGRPEPGRRRLIEGVGTLAVGYGFQPVIDLTTALGAAHVHDPARGGWACRTEAATGATSVPGLYAAGETTGIGGARPALLSGQIAGAHAAAAALNRPAPGAALDPVRRDLARARRFAAGLSALWPPFAAAPVAPAAAEFACRCEDVSFADLRAAIAEGANETFAVKMWTRAGMGPCQGRICGGAIAAELAAAGIPPERAGYNRSHLPLRPVPAPLLAASLDESGETA